MTDIGLIGSGGHSDEVAANAGVHIAFRAVTAEYRNDRAQVDIDQPGEYVDYPVHIAIGAPYVRRMMAERWAGKVYVGVTSVLSRIDATARCDEGCYIAPFSLVSTNVKLGKHVIVNAGVLIHHDSKLGDFVTICPGASLGGGVTLGDGVFVGIGATISNGVTVAPGVVIGAGAAVVADLDQENGIYVGVPAKLVGVNEDWLREI